MASGARILVLYYSMYGHVERLAEAVAEGARRIDGATVSIKRVPELMPEPALRKGGAKLDQAAPVATADELPDYDAIVFGTPTRFGNMCVQMRNFLDQTGRHWTSGALVGKVGSVFTATATQHGGQETTITSSHSTLLHQGMVIVGVPYTCKALLAMGEITGGSSYGAGTLAGSDGKRAASENELAIARFQGERVAAIACRLASG